MHTWCIDNLVFGINYRNCSQVSPIDFVLLLLCVFMRHSFDACINYLYHFSCIIIIMFLYTVQDVCLIMTVMDYFVWSIVLSLLIIVMIVWQCDTQLCSGEFIGALAMSEHSAGSDVVSMKTSAIKQGLQICWLTPVYRLLYLLPAVMFCCTICVSKELYIVPVVLTVSDALESVTKVMKRLDRYRCVLNWCCKLSMAFASMCSNWLIITDGLNCWLEITGT